MSTKVIMTGGLNSKVTYQTNIFVHFIYVEYIASKSKIIDYESKSWVIKLHYKVSKSLASVRACIAVRVEASKHGLVK